LVQIAHSCGGSVLGIQNVDRQDTKKYGIISGSRVDECSWRVDSMVEKPDPADAPTTQAVVGRYVLEPQIFDYLQATKPGAGGEIQLTDGIAAMLRERPVFAYQYEGTRYDCGNKQGFFSATVALGRKYHNLG